MLNYIALFLILFFSVAFKVFAESKLYMLTDDKCIYCIVWEKQIGKIYSKTEIAKAFPLERIHINEIDKLEKKTLFNTNITPTFVFYRNDKEIGRIKSSNQSGLPLLTTYALVKPPKVIVILKRANNNIIFFALASLFFKISSFIKIYQLYLCR